VNAGTAGRVVAVTGGVQGIGAAIAEAFEANGDVVAVIDIDERAPYPCDVADRDVVEETFAKITSDHGPVDVLINNAGINPVGPSEDFPELLWRRCFDVIANGTFYCSQVAAQDMLRRGSGSIVNITSINATEAFPERLAYCASKAAVNMMTQVLAIEWASRGIRVNAVAPGVVRTPLTERLIGSGIIDEAFYVDRIPVGRLGSPDEIARSVVFLADDEAATFITGTTLVVDGGWSAYGYATTRSS
jgi:NAD(P)-dependent dehydrogenase (short-subunit alcohol dehydrogenase family)